MGCCIMKKIMVVHLLLASQQIQVVHGGKLLLKTKAEKKGEEKLFLVETIAKEKRNNLHGRKDRKITADYNNNIICHQLCSELYFDCEYEDEYIEVECPTDTTNLPPPPPPPTPPPPPPPPLPTTTTTIKTTTTTSTTTTSTTATTT